MKDKILLILASIGIIDTIYLINKQSLGSLAPCRTGTFSDCSLVLTSKYAHILGFPLSKIGFIYYVLIFYFAYLVFKNGSTYAKKWLITATTAGFLFSGYLVYLQLIVLKAICVYCMVSAVTSTLLFISSLILFNKERVYLFGILFGLFYKNVIRKILFLIDPEVVHNKFVAFGEMLGKNKYTRNTIGWLFNYKDPKSKKRLAGITFPGPVGLAAGFDYDANLTQSLDMIGFGFQTVGTVTNLHYEGNPRPMLGRLPKSQSLMVNKGFKSLGAKTIANKLKGVNFAIPVGISIGRSNYATLNTQRKSINDIIKSFKIFEKAKIKNAFYELNISCPNLIHSTVTFYPPKNLEELLSAVDKLNIKKPIFIKMPIEKTDKEVLSMLKVINKHKVAGVIFGNLQKNRKDKTLVQTEVNKFKVGNFSGKPTFKRSNELIKLTKKNYNDRFVIIGCGGIFSAKDAQTKLDLGADLVQLITGMIFEGPQLISTINCTIGK